jgi:hypothetical protein
MRKVHRISGWLLNTLKTQAHHHFDSSLYEINIQTQNFTTAT